MSGHRFFTSVTRISDLRRGDFQVEPLPRSRWATGDYVAVEILSTSSGQRLELDNGRLIEVAEGDIAVGALGVRHATLEATGTWKEVGEDHRIDFLTAGGLLGRCTSRSTVIPPLTAALYRGHVRREGEKTTMAGAAGELEDSRGFRSPVVMIVGTSMSAGKTTAAGIIIRLLKRTRDLRVLGAKIAGAARYRDVLTMHDAGADAIYDFVDVGLPSTVCGKTRYRRALRALLSRMAGEEPDVAVVEVGASPLEPYNGAVAIEEIRDRVVCLVLCSSDPYAAVGVMEAYEAEPSLITGVASNTRAGVELTEELTGIRTLNIRDKSAHPELLELLSERLGL